MEILTLGFMAAVPVGHTIRTYRAQRMVESMGWIGAGAADVLFDMNTGIVYASRHAKPRIAPGEPIPEDPEMRWTPEREARVALCIVTTYGGPGSGHETGMVTRLGLEAAGSAAYR